MLSINNSIALVELLGVLAFAFTGIIEARKKRMDLFGAYAVRVGVSSHRVNSLCLVGVSSRCV